jgi:hypothetical protein
MNFGSSFIIFGDLMNFYGIYKPMSIFQMVYPNSIEFENLA